MKQQSHWFNPTHQDSGTGVSALQSQPISEVWDVERYPGHLRNDAKAVPWFGIQCL